MNGVPVMVGRSKHHADDHRSWARGARLNHACSLSFFSIILDTKTNW